MSLPIKTLPIVERWDCTGCGLCCRGNVVPLDDDDMERLRGQAWDQHPDFQGIATVVRQGLLGKTHRLAQRDDGTCVFLMEDGLCRIHKDYGLEAKPLICRMYPLQLVPLNKTAILTLRRSCPTAASDKGRPLDEYRKIAATRAKQRGLFEKPVLPPRTTRRQRLPWPETLRVAGVLERLTCDDGYPLVRRLVHGLRFCRLMEQCKLRRFDGKKLDELLRILEASSYDDVGELFRDRQAPSRAAAVLFRQSLAEYIRLHPKYVIRETWRERIRLLRFALQMARGKGDTPDIHPGIPVSTFEALEEPLGHTATEIQTPLNRFFEVNSASKQYAIVSKPGWSLIESYRALALSFPAALWILRLCCGDREPTAEDAIDMVTMIDRGQGFEPLTSRRHRHRVTTLARLDDLERLVVWYAR